MTTLQDLETAHLEWGPWLSVVRIALAELDGTQWDASVPRLGRSEPDMPLLACARLQASERAVMHLFQKLRRAAIRSDMPKLVAWNEWLSSERGAMSVFLAAVIADEARLAELASVVRVDPEAFTAVAGLLPIPFLHACRRAWLPSPRSDWHLDYCPCCGSWPGFVEVCGVERRRYLRCIRCASAWASVCLRCAYCGTSDHERLGSLLADDGKGKVAIETCAQCSGYIKVFHRLGLAAPAEVATTDLASVGFDIAASERGYRRPAATGFAFGRAAVKA